MNRILLTALLVAGCSEYEVSKIPDATRLGELTLTGRICDPIRGTWLEGATVYTHLFDKDDKLFGTSTYITDDDGYYTLDRLASGYTYTIYVQYGNELIEKFEVTMPEENLTLDEPNCSALSLSNVAVITGDYDDYSTLLPSVGIDSYDVINGLTGETLVQFLSNEDKLLDYDAIFFPGGHLEEDVIYDTDGSDTSYKHLEVQDALRSYVKAGGVVYASDWSYDVVENIWPDAIDFLGDDTIPDAAQMGDEASLLASVADSSLESAVGSSQVAITFDLIEWPVMEGVGSGTTVLLRGTVPYRVGFETYTLTDVPILVEFEDGDGRVVFSSWRQSSNATGDALEVIRFLTEDI